MENTEQTRETEPESDPPIDSDFIREYCKSRGAVFTDPNFMAIIWASLQSFSLWWVLTKNRPLDFGFVKLESVPLRRNWLAILARRRKQGKKSFEHAIESLRALTSWDKEHSIIRWDCHATPMRLFNKAARLIELERKKSNPLYLVAVQEMLIAHRPRIHEIFKAYLEETTRKNIHFSCGPGSRYWVAPIARVRQTDPPGMEPDNGVCGMVEKGEPEVVASEDANVLSVPDIQQNCPDLWNAGRDVDCARVEPAKNGAFGLHVLHAAEGETEGELLPLRRRAGDNAEASLGAGIEQLPDCVDRNGEEK